MTTTITTYVDEAIRTAPTLKRDDHSLVLAGIGLIGEAVEAFEAARKLVINKAVLIKELGDVTWYAALLCFVVELPFVNYEITTRAAQFYVASAGSGDDQYKAIETITSRLVISAKNVSEFVKKQVFHNHPNDTLKMNQLLRIVLRDVQIAAAWAGVDFETVLSTNIEKLKIRYPERFTPEASINKDEAREHALLSSEASAPE